MKSLVRIGLVGAAVALAPVARMYAQEPAAGHDATDLAKASQNPVGDLISLPFQFDFNTGGGLEDRTFFSLNFQPVMPIKVTPSINLIARTIVPVVSIPGPDGLRVSGVADFQQQLFLTPASQGKIIWGVGPAFSLPTATADVVKPAPGPAASMPSRSPCTGRGSSAA